MAEQRLIDSNKFERYIDCGHLRPPYELCFSENDVVNMILKQPTVDAVPVIRCKDCKHRDEEYTDQFGGIWCDMHGEVEISKNYFCASGEQKDGEQDEL